jgi:AcrR family transcriptional regulator
MVDLHQPAAVAARRQGSLMPEPAASEDRICSADAEPTVGGPCMTAVEAGAPGVNAKKRDRVRTTIVAAANEIFETKSFHASTTAEIAARAGISQRTFFRYFACKEDVVLEWLDSYMERICQRLRNRPADEPPLQALRRAVDHFCHLPVTEIERVEFLRQLMQASETLRARLLLRNADWEAHIACEMEARGVPRVRSAFLANFTMGVLNVTFRDRPLRDQDLVEDLIDEGFRAFEDANESLSQIQAS